MPVTQACKALQISRATYYRINDWTQDRATEEVPTRAKRISPRALSTSEREAVLNMLHSERFIDKAPAAICAELLDDGIYLCSVRTMYRILDENGEVKERRNQRQHPIYTKPELLAAGPNQVWSWDITKLKGPRKGNLFYLYVIIDIFSRYVVGWKLASRETAEQAAHLIKETCKRQCIDQDQLVIHSDRGSPMTSQSVSMLLSKLGVLKSHGRPSVSNDNPYSESGFKTLKYRPTFPDRFGCIEDALLFCRHYFTWYNEEHYHSGIAMMTPSVVHHGEAPLCNEQRQHALNKAYVNHPNRFVKGAPKALELPAAVWINPPVKVAFNDTTLSITMDVGTEVTVR